MSIGKLIGHMDNKLLYFLQLLCQLNATLSSTCPA